MTDKIQAALNKIGDSLTNAKDRADFDKALASMGDLAIASGAKEAKIDCQGCQMLDKLFKMAWEISKKDYHTFKYQCHQCERWWISTFYKTK